MGKFILASSSPRRRELLTEAAYEFRVVDPPLDEPTDHIGLRPIDQAESLAYFKARAVIEAFRPDVPVLGADTVVALGERVFGKPADAAHAREILSTLGGTRHAVITGVALIAPDGYRLIASDTTYVQMRALGPAEMDAYIAGGAWQGKAGAYGIQDSGDPFVVALEGSFSNVVGLPLELVRNMLEQESLRRNHGAGDVI
jgi:septum formation protein